MLHLALQKGLPLAWGRLVELVILEHMYMQVGHQILTLELVLVDMRGHPARRYKRFIPVPPAQTLNQLLSCNNF